MSGPLDRLNDMLEPDTVIFATDDSADGIAAAREWLKAQKFTADDVRLIKRDGQCLIITKRSGIAPKLIS